MTVASDAIRSLSLELYEAARKEGIVAGDPLWVWVKSQVIAINSMADLTDEQHVRLGAVLADAKEVASNQAVVLEATLKLAEEHNKRTQMASQHMQIQQETLVNRTISDLTEQVSSKLSGALMLRQRRYDLVHFWGSVGLVSSLALALFFGGFGLHAYEWRNDIGALQRCMKTALPNSAGTWYCEMRSVRGW